MSKQDFLDRLDRACPPASARLIELQSGQHLFRQGDAPPGLPFVLRVQIDLVRWTEAGRATRIHVARTGETFAEASLHARECHCDAVAGVPSTLRLVPRRVVLDAFDASPALAQAFTVHLASALMTARRLLELRAITPLTERILTRLGELADADGAIPGHITLMSVAADLDVTPPALYRSIATLERQGALVRPARGRVRLLTEPEPGRAVNPAPDPAP